MEILDTIIFCFIVLPQEMKASPFCSQAGAIAVQKPTRTGPQARHHTKHHNQSALLSLLGYFLVIFNIQRNFKAYSPGKKWISILEQKQAVQHSGLSATVTTIGQSDGAHPVSISIIMSPDGVFSLRLFKNHQCCF